MSKELTTAKNALSAIERSFSLRKNDIGQDAKLCKKGMTFYTDTYEIDGVGHLCVMRMRSLFGIMKMETVVISPLEKDLPVFNVDRVSAFGKETLIVELYNKMIEEYPQDKLAQFDRIKEADPDLPDKESAPAWYDSLKFSQSIGKSGKKLGARFDRTEGEYVTLFIEQAKDAVPCDVAEKTRLVREFAETLYEKGGPAVNTFKKLFGEETAKRMVIKNMYGIEP